MQPVTPAERRAFEAIVEHIATHGIPPTIRDLCDALGVSTNAVAEVLDRLQSKGWIDREHGSARSLVVAHGVLSVVDDLRRFAYRRAGYRDARRELRRASSMVVQAIEDEDDERLEVGISYLLAAGAQFIDEKRQ